MKMRSRKALVFVLALIVLLTAAPVVINAADTAALDFINGTPAVLPAGVTWENNVLTLDNAEITVAGGFVQVTDSAFYMGPLYAAVALPDGAVVSLKGDSTVTYRGEGRQFDNTAVIGSAGALTFTGEEGASLTVKFIETIENNICLDTAIAVVGDLSVEKVAVYADVRGEDDDCAPFNAYGVNSAAGLSVLEQAAVSVTVGGAQELVYGVYSDGNLTVENSLLDVTTADGVNKAYGVYVEYDLSFRDRSSVHVNAGDANAVLYGILSSEGSIAADSSAVTVVTGDAAEGASNYGVWAKQSILIGDSSVSVTTGDSGKYNFGVYASDNGAVVTIAEGSDVAVKTGGAGYRNYAVYVNGGFAVDDSSVSVTAGGAGAGYGCYCIFTDENTTVAGESAVVTLDHAAGEYAAYGIFCEGDDYIGGRDGRLAVDEALDVINGADAENDAFVSGTTKKLVKIDGSLPIVIRRTVDEEVEAVIAAIDDIGEVELTKETGEKIGLARELYDALTEEQQELVTNRGVLLDAEAAFAELTAQAAAMAAVTAAQYNSFEPMPMMMFGSYRFVVNGGRLNNRPIIPYGVAVDPNSFVPTRAGYTFDGWYLDAALTVPAAGRYAAGGTFYAGWTPAN